MKVVSPRRIGVVADDFTGAADVAVAFRRAGFSCEISLFPPGRPSPGARVHVIDTESRHLPPAAAAARVRRAVHALRGWGADFLYKKIDSTLRGPVAAEARAFLRAARARKPAAFAPAFPALGRTTRGGVQFVAGVPVARSAFGRDPLAPVRESRLDRLLGPLLSKGDVAAPDVAGSRDLRRLARRIAAGRSLASGAAIASAGLAEELARLWGGRGMKKDRLSRAAGPVLVVVGSAHPVSARQARRLRRALRGRVRVLGDFPRQSRHLTMCLNSAKKSISGPFRGRFVYLLRAPSRRGRAARVLAALAASAFRWSRALAIDRFVVTGGETAVALARLWGVRRWRLAGEVERGAGLCVPAVPSRRVRCVALKPGGFGDDETLVRCVRGVQRA